jgi:hypothetical protein
VLLLQERVLPLQLLQPGELAALLGGRPRRGGAPQAACRRPSRTSFRHFESMNGWIASAVATVWT